MIIRRHYKKQLCSVERVRHKAHQHQRERISPQLPGGFIGHPNNVVLLLSLLYSASYSASKRNAV